MRVCIDCSPLLMRSAGVKTYVYHLTRHLLAAFGPESVLAFPFLGQIGELDHDRSVAGRWATLVRLGLLSMANRRMISPAWLVPPADLFHASNQMRRATGHGKLTGTIHDVTSWLMPDLHRSGTLIADREYAELIWKRADGLIAVSHKSKQDAVEVLGIAADKITVVYHGIADSYFEVTTAQISKMREIYRIQKPYVLFLSTIEPRKNLDRLITAYESMSNANRSEFDLLVGGPYGWNSEATMQRLVQSPKGVRYLGYVPEHHLPALFAGATLFVYPSLYEGFGLPVLQSMAAGTPVLLSFAGALPEIAADCAAYIDPYSADDLSNGLTRMLLSPSERVRFSEAGRLRAARFQWTACAHQTWEFFQNIIGSERGSAPDQRS